MSAGGDVGLQSVLDALGVRPDSVLGWGGEARVYALDDRRVLRVLHPGGHAGGIRSRQLLVRELGSRGAPFALPDFGTVNLDVSDNTGDLPGGTKIAMQDSAGVLMAKPTSIANGTSFNEKWLAFGRADTSSC